MTTWTEIEKHLDVLKAERYKKVFPNGNPLVDFMEQLLSDGEKFENNVQCTARTKGHDTLHTILHNACIMIDQFYKDPSDVASCFVIVKAMKIFDGITEKSIEAIGLRCLENTPVDDPVHEIATRFKRNAIKLITILNSENVASIADQLLREVQTQRQT